MKTKTLFVLNIIDALLTLYWIESGSATEGNGIMSYFLAQGVGVFLTVKILMAATTSITLEYFQQYRVARIGLNFVLGVYIALMFVHLATAIYHFSK